LNKCMITSSFDSHCLKSKLPGVEMETSFSCSPLRLLGVKPNLRVNTSVMGAAPWLTNPVGAALRVSCTTRLPETADIIVKKFASLRKDIGMNSEAKWLVFKPHPGFQWGNNDYLAYKRITQGPTADAREEPEGTSNRDDTNRRERQCGRWSLGRSAQLDCNSLTNAGTEVRRMRQPRRILSGHRARDGPPNLSLYQVAQPRASLDPSVNFF
jgi:hypothetical protein